MNQPKPLRVCYFGTYRTNYSRNQIMLQGLRGQGVQVIECHATLWQGIEDRVAQASGGWKNPRFWGRVLKSYRQLIHTHAQIDDYDLLMLGYPGQFDAYLGWVLSRRRGKPMVIDLYMSLYLIAVERGLVAKSPFTGKLIRWLEARGLKLANRIISDTAEYVAYHCQTYGLKPEKFRLVPAGADDRLFYPQPNVHPPTDHFRVVYHGTFLPSHGIETMVRAAAELQDIADIQFYFYGDGPERPSAEQLAQKLELKQVYFVGWVEKEKMPAQIAQAHLCLGVFGTTQQSRCTIQNKIWESMAVGRPVISGDSPTVRATLHHQQQIFLVQRNNPTALAQAILTLQKDPALREQIARAGHTLFQNHTIAATGEKTVAILRELLLNQTIP